MKKKLANMSQNLFLLRTHIRIKVRHEYEKRTQSRNSHKKKSLEESSFSFTLVAHRKNKYSGRTKTSDRTSGINKNLDTYFYAQKCVSACLFI